MAKITTEQMAQLLMGVARAQLAIIDSIELKAASANHIEHALEMMPETLKETTLDPKTRTLLRVDVEKNTIDY